MLKETKPLHTLSTKEGRTGGELGGLAKDAASASRTALGVGGTRLQGPHDMFLMFLFVPMLNI